MSEDNALVLVAGYQDLDSARHDFQTLVDAAKDKSIPLQGAVLIGKDAEGSPVLVDTGNRLGRRGAAWGAGVGLAIGLFSPALLASAALGRDRSIGRHLRPPSDQDRAGRQDRPSAGGGPSSGHRRDGGTRPTGSGAGVG